MRAAGAKSAEVVGVESLGRRELPVDRAELAFELGHAGCEEPLDRGAGFGEDAAVGGEARALHRKDEVVRRCVAPFPEAVGGLGAVIGAVDLDRGELSAGVFEFARMGQALGIEGPAPWLVVPAADADLDLWRSRLGQAPPPLPPICAPPPPRARRSARSDRPGSGERPRSAFPPPPRRPRTRSGTHRSARLGSLYGRPAGRRRWRSRSPRERNRRRRAIPARR